jgi:superfamily II RNA helicase
MLSANEFLQMSGRAGRRGMDEIGYVVVIGTPFQTPDEVANLVKSDANPLESKFSPSYSMVLNLLQRFSLEESKELIFKTFGYFSSTDRLTPLLKKKEARQVFVRRYFYGDSIEDIAKRFTFSESKIKSMLHRTRLALREYLTQNGVYI